MEIHHIYPPNPLNPPPALLCVSEIQTKRTPTATDSIRDSNRNVRIYANTNPWVPATQIAWNFDTDLHLSKHTIVIVILAVISVVDIVGYINIYIYIYIVPRTGLEIRGVFE